MLHKSTRLLLLGGMLVIFACIVPFVSFSLLSLSNYADSSTIPYPTRIPCTPVPDPMRPHVYPNAQQVAFTPSPTRTWLGLIHTYSFETQDDADTILNYYRDTMVREGWFFEYQLSDLLKTPGTTGTVTYPDHEVRSMPGVQDVQGYAAFCNTSSAHPIRVAVVVIPLDSGHTRVLLRVY